MSLPSPARVGRFEIERLLGRGGMGAVYQARDPDLDRAVAIKLLDEPQSDRSLRLLREAQALAQLQHPNVVAVHEVGTAGEHVFVAMELVDGASLADLTPPPATWREAVALFVQAGRGLAAAHERGLVHRDVKPSNILVGRDGRVRVGDFGLARLGSGADGDSVTDAAPTGPEPDANATTVAAAAAGETAASDDTTDAPAGPTDVLATPVRRGLLGSELTRVGAYLGTPRYMAPEQHARRAATARSDQFAFCVSLWETIFGEHPFADHAEGIGAAVIAGTRRPTPPGRAPAWLVRALDRGLALEPEQRHRSMAALVEVLEHTPLQRRRNVRTGIGVALLAGAALVGWQLSDRAPSRVACGEAGAPFAQVWSPARRAAIEAAFAAHPAGADLGARTLAAIDGHGERWRAARIDACRATYERGEQSSTVLDRRMECLDRSLASVEAVLGRLATADRELLDHALPAVMSFPDPAGCNATRLEAALPYPDDPRVDAIRADLAAAIAANALGDAATARARITAARTAADALGHPGLRAEVAVQYASDVNDDPQLDALLQGALADAVAAGDRETEALLLIALLEQANGRLDADAINSLLPIARAATRRPGVSPRTQRFGYYAEADALTRLGRHDDALAACDRYGELEEPPRWRTARCRCIANTDALRGEAAYESCQVALDAAEAAFGKSGSPLTEAMSSLAKAALAIGKTDEAIALRERVLTIDRTLYGEDSPNTAHALCGFGFALEGLGRPAEARPHVERCLAIYERHEASGPPSAYRASALRMYGNLLVTLGEVDTGLDHLARARALMEQVVGAEHPDYLVTLAIQINALNTARRFADVPPLATRCVALAAKLNDGAEDMIGGLCTMLHARALANTERAPAAVTMARDAVRILEATDDAPQDIGEAYLVLGTALAAARRPAEARTALEKAVVIFESLGPASAESAADAAERLRRLR